MDKQERRTFTKEFKLDVIQQSYHREQQAKLYRKLLDSGKVKTNQLLLESLGLVGLG